MAVEEPAPLAEAFEEDRMELLSRKPRAYLQCRSELGVSSERITRWLLLTWCCSPAAAAQNSGASS